jgi:hypothetical protein
MRVSRCAGIDTSRRLLSWIHPGKKSALLLARVYGRSAKSSFRRSSLDSSIDGSEAERERHVRRNFE